MEKIFLVDENKLIVGLAGRKYAEKVGWRHISNIAILFDVRDSKWILHDRYNKIAAKAIAVGEKPPPLYESYNANGGHPATRGNGEKLIGMYVDEAFIVNSMREELDSEALIKILKETKGKIKGEVEVEEWENGVNTGETFRAKPYHIPLFNPIPIGWAEYSKKTESGFNSEYSYVWAVPCFSDIGTCEKCENLLIADDYEVDGVANRNVLLPHKKFTLEEIKSQVEAQEKAGKSIVNSVEMADAVSRLFTESANAETLNKLQKTIEEYTRKYNERNTEC